ncbi:MAG: DUF202 domain-containing protein [Actinomycetota bacterium]
MSAQPPIVDDEETPGLAGERTDLAWSRSGLAIVAVVAAILRRVLDADRHGAAVITAALLAGAAVAWVLAMGHARAVTIPALAGRAHADRRELRAVAAGTALLGVGALVLALVPDE